MSGVSCTTSSMGTTDLATWGFDPALLLTPSHHKWTAAITFSRRYKLRGFPDLTASPVVALCSIELTGGNPAAVDVRVLRRVTDGESAGIEQKLLEELASREPAVDAIAHSDSLGPRWCGTRFWWCVPDPSQRLIESELEFLHTLFSSLRTQTLPSGPRGFSP